MSLLNGHNLFIIKSKIKIELIGSCFVWNLSGEKKHIFIQPSEVDIGPPLFDDLLIVVVLRHSKAALNSIGLIYQAQMLLLLANFWSFV